MKIVLLGAVLAALLGFRIWGANRRRGRFPRSPNPSPAPLPDRPATVRLLLAVSVAALVVVAYLSFREVAG